MQPRNLVFISYCDADQDHVNKLLCQLRPSERDGTLLLWEKSRITAGYDRKKEIKMARKQTRIAVILTSPDYLADDQLMEQEFSYFEKLAQSKHLSLYWIPLRPA